MLTHYDLTRMLPAVGDFGQLIRLRRLEAGISQHDLAKAAGLSVGAISLIERGERSPTLASVQRITAVLGIEVRFESIRKEPVAVS